MKPIFELCKPRPEVLHGEIKEDIFAARLKDVMDGTGDDIYKDARTFFDNTYPTAGLQTLLKDALGRMVGDAAGKNAVIRLETAFGGGKTHNLIALYHVASGHAPEEAVKPIVGDVPLPQPGDIKIAGVVGSDLDPSLGVAHGNIRTYTLWGELAYQLGGAEGYKFVAESEKTKSAPGTGLLEHLVGEQPTLIMLDEIARHLRAGLAIPSATQKSTLADQTVAFIMSLLEFAASKERCLVVLTLASDADAFSGETNLLREKLNETLSVSTRQERVLTPTEENEIYAIVTHRLFQSVDRQGAASVFDAYAAYYTALNARGADLPQRSVRAQYIGEMKDAYPFHPELLNTLNRKTATIPNFNQTRGALRLLAWTVRTLWNEKPPHTWMIHPYHLDLSDSKVVEDLTGRLNRPKFKQVVEADVVSPMRGAAAHAEEVDRALQAAGKPPYARRLATTIFLHSLTQGVASGVDPADLMLAVLTPDGSQKTGDDPAVVQRTLERLYSQSWFLEYDGHRYRFKTEPSLNKIVQDETSQVGLTKAKLEIERRIRKIWKKGYFTPVYFPVEPGDVDDDAVRPKLAIIHFEAVHVGVGETAPPSLVRKISEYAGTLDAFRQFRNNLIFLVADTDQAANMVRVARRYLAIGRIVGDSQRMAEFNKEQRTELKKMHEAAELDVRVAITKAYRYLYYPTADAPKTDAFLRRETLPAQEQGDVENDQTNVILRVLRALNKVLTTDDKTLSAVFVKSKAWDMHQTHLSTEELRKVFARKVSLRILLDVNQLRATIRNGVETGVWIYYDAESGWAYDKDSPPPAFAIGNDTFLYLPEEARRVGLRIKGKWKEAAPEDSPDTGGTALHICPVCGNPEDACTCGITAGATSKPAKLVGSGAVNQAFQQIADQAIEYDIHTIERLFIRVEGSGKLIAENVRAIGLAIPQFGKGQFGIEMEMVASFGADEMYRQEFRGNWARYKRLKSVVEAFAAEASEVKISMSVAATFDTGLAVASSQFANMREILNTLGLGKITVEAIPPQAGTP